jgi:LysR family transcriptional regulator, transcription activator of glutamate synthase operon
MDRINPDLLKTFLEVARAEHLGRAADNLIADQSTVSRKIVRLEQEVGVPLFERIGRNIRLTEAGKRFVVRAERLLNELRDAVNDAQHAMTTATGLIHVGFLHTVGARWLPERISRFLKGHPQVRFVLNDGTAAEVTTGVLNGDHDIGIVGPPPHNVPELEIVPIFRELIAVVTYATHPLAKQKSCTLSDLTNEPLILLRSRSGLRRVIDDAFTNQGMSPTIAYEADDFSIIQGLVEAKLGITLMPTPLPTPSTDLVAVPLRDPPVMRTMAMIWDRRRTLPPAALLFAQELRSEAPEVLDSTV